MPCEQIGSFSSELMELTFNKNDAEHRRLIRHLYRRIGYGASWADIEYADGKTIDELVDKLVNNHLNDYQRDDKGNISYDVAGNPTVVVGGATHIFNDGKFDWVNRDITLQRIEDDGDIVNALPPTRQNELISNYLTNESIIGSSNSVRAKLMQFWQNHFVIEERHPDAGRPLYLLRYFKILFNNAFGNFRTFVEEIGRTPAMLGYLNGYLNICNPGNDGSRTPDENYARELLELFTMGEEYHGQPNYSDADVNNLARALSGWTFDGLSPVEGEFRFRYALHDWTVKTFVDGTIEGGITPDEPTTPIDASSPYWEAVFGVNSRPPGEETLPSNYTFRADKGTVIGIPLDSALLPFDDIDQDANFYAQYPNSVDTERAYLTAAHLEYKAVHRIIFENRTDAIAYFICRKLYEFYIYGDVEGLNRKLELQDNNLTQLDNYIEELADIFKGNNTTYTAQGYAKWDIIPVLKQLFKSQHFYDAGIIGAQIKSPVECGASIFRAANLKGGWGTDDSLDYRYKVQLLEPGAAYTHALPAPNLEATPPIIGHINYNGNVINWMTGEGIDTEAFIGSELEAIHAYRSLQDTDTWKLIYQHWGAMGQLLFNPPDVAGWPGHQFWLNEFTWMRRREMMHYFIQERFINTLAIDKFISLAIDLPNISDAEISQSEYTFNNDITPLGGVKLVWKMWRHFFAVEPTERQIKDGVAVYLEAHTYSDFPPPIAGDVQSKKRIADLLEYFTKQPEYQLN